MSGQKRQRELLPPRSVEDVLEFLSEIFGDDPNVLAPIAQAAKNSDIDGEVGLILNPSWLVGVVYRVAFSNTTVDVGNQTAYSLSCFVSTSWISAHGMHLQTLDADSVLHVRVGAS
jgi:hypothetical protein